MSLTDVVVKLWKGRQKPVPVAPVLPITEKHYEKNGVPWVEVRRGDRLLAYEPEPGYVEPQESIDKMLISAIPVIAPGNWQALGAGDYKAVYRPENGKADYVVKSIGHTYQTREEAEHAADAYRIAYRIVSEEIGQHLLKVRDVKVGPTFNGQDFGIYKLQDYGELISAWALGEGKREQALEASHAASAQIDSAQDKIWERLSAAGISTISLIFDRAWDYRSGRLVVFDIFDSVGWRQPARAAKQQ